MNTPPDSSGSSPTKQNSPLAIPNQPNGKPLHERTRSLPTGGEEYGHPYLDQSQSTGLSRRVATDDFYWDISDNGELVEVRVAKINIRPSPKKRQREQKGQVKRDYKIRRRTWGRKNKDKIKNQRKRHYRRNRRQRLRQMELYRRNPQRRKRLQGGGVSTNRQRNNKNRKAFQEVLAMEFYDVDSNGELVLAEDRLGYKKMPSQQRDKMLKSRKKNINKNVSKKRQRRNKDKKNVSLKTKRKNWLNRTKSVRKYSSVSTKLKAMQLFLAVLRGAHWAHWTSHWQVKGSNSYGDHLLLQRLYEGIEEEIDTLAEKIVGEFGAESVEPVEQAKLMANEILPRADFKDPIDRALFVETALQEAFKLIYDTLKSQNSLSLGLDDYIMSIANAHETNLYLLRQRKDSHNG